MIHRKRPCLPLQPGVCERNFDITFSATEPSGGASGQASDIAIHAKEILRVRGLLTGIYQRHCGKPGESEATGLKRFGMSILVYQGQ